MSNLRNGPSHIHVRYPLIVPTNKDPYSQGHVTTFWCSACGDDVVIGENVFRIKEFIITESIKYYYVHTDINIVTFINSITHYFGIQSTFTDSNMCSMSVAVGG